MSCVIISDVNKDLSHKDKDKDKDLGLKDKDKDLGRKDKEKDKDLGLKDKDKDLGRKDKDKDKDLIKSLFKDSVKKIASQSQRQGFHQKQDVCKGGQPYRLEFIPKYQSM